MSTTLHLLDLTRRRQALEIEIADIESHLDLVTDHDAAVRRLNHAREELSLTREALRDLRGHPEPDQGPRYTLTAQQAAERLGIGRRQLLCPLGDN